MIYHLHEVEKYNYDSKILSQYNIITIDIVPSKQLELPSSPCTGSLFPNVPNGRGGKIVFIECGRENEFVFGTYNHSTYIALSLLVFLA